MGSLPAPSQKPWISRSFSSGNEANRVSSVGVIGACGIQGAVMIVPIWIKMLGLENLVRISLFGQEALPLLSKFLVARIATYNRIEIGHSTIFLRTNNAP